MLEASSKWFRRARAAWARATTDATYVVSTYRENKLECPATSCGAKVVSLQNQQTGAHTDVVSCSELHPGESCARGCLAQLTPSSTST